MLAISTQYNHRPLDMLTQISMISVKQLLILPGLFELANSTRTNYSKQRGDDLIADQALSGYRGLMAAVVYQAKQDAERGNAAALSWLNSDHCADYCIALGVDHKAIIKWVDRKRAKVERLQKMADQVEKLKNKIAEDHGLPGVFTEWLRGETEAEITADAERLIKFIRPEAVVLNIQDMTPQEIRENKDKLLKQMADENKKAGWIR
jgi:hypothetical protein